MKYKVEDLGQVFTPDDIVNQMIDLIKNGWRVFEPSCGDGAFSNQLNQKFDDVQPRELPDFQYDANKVTNNATLSTEKSSKGLA